MGLVILQDWKNILYAIISSFLIYIGYSIIKNPYATYSDKEIILFSFYGKSREKHEFSDKKAVKVTEKNIFLEGKKLKMNSWFLRQADWRRLREFYSPDQNASLLSELQD